MTREEEERILDLAVARGMLGEEQAARVRSDAARDTVSMEGRWGGRLDLLVQRGLLEDAAIAALAREADTRDEGEARATGDEATASLEPRDDPPESIPGLFTWDRYRVERLLGAGGSGIVYLGHDVRLDRPAAIKFLSRSAERSLGEARAQARVEHENVCKVYEVGKLGSRPYIAMQYVAGETLRQAARALTREEIVTVIRDVAEAVHAAHRIGLIHRDLKPANILIERPAQERVKPYVVDFGLAKELSAPGSTVTGSILGTPLYMAPEQARGDVRRLDRRTDVYALGATLYEALSGAPPFQGDGVSVLLHVIHDDPPPLRRAEPSIAVDLDSIVMKCLEKDPARRYDSARALAEDLDRYLRGVPVLARRTGALHRAARWARRHRALAALSIAALAAVAALGVGWARSLARAREQAELARRFGEDVKEIETLTRLSHLSPLHDTRPDRARVRARIDAIERAVAGRSGAARAAGEYAIGRGYLALRRHAEARAHLAEAERQGPRSPALALALAEVLGAIYDEELDEARHITDATARAARVAVIEKELRDPARVYLEEVRAVTTDSAAMIEALLRFREGRHAEALERARAAARELPWSHEARKLEGDVHRKLGGDADDAGKYDAALASYAEASDAYAEAAAIGRSDAAVHEADCRVRGWALGLQVESLQQKAPDDLFERAIAACDAAIRADPETADAPEQKSLILQIRASQALDRGGDPRVYFDEAIAAAQQAVAARPERAFAHATLGLALREKASQEASHGADPRPSIGAAVAAFERAVRIEPSLTMAHNGLGIVYRARADYEVRHGLDPRQALEGAVAGYRRAAELGFVGAWNNIGRAYVTGAEYEIEHGLDARASIDRAVEALEEAVEKIPGNAIPHNSLGGALVLRAAIELREGRDPRPLLGPAHEAYARALAVGPSFGSAHKNKGDAHRMAADHERRSGLDPAASAASAVASYEDTIRINAKYAGAHRGIARALAIAARGLIDGDRDPAAPLARARAALDAASAIAPGDPDTAIARAEVELAAAAWDAKRGNAPDRALAAAEAALREARAASGEIAAVHTLLAELAIQRSEWLRARREEAGATIAAGLAAAADALRINPRDARSAAARDALVRLRRAP